MTLQTCRIFLENEEAHESDLLRSSIVSIGHAGLWAQGNGILIQTHSGITLFIRRVLHSRNGISPCDAKRGRDVVPASDRLPDPREGSQGDRGAVQEN